MSSIRHYIEIVEQAGRGLIRAYHGTPHQFDVFDPEHAADGHAQEGAGFYFTTHLPDAETYATEQGRVLVVDLDVSRELAVRGKVNPKHVEMLMRQAPDLEDTLTNWDENPDRAFRMALSAMLKGDGPKACFENVWYDFYRDTPADYLRNVAALGYGGTLIPKVLPDGGQFFHIIMYDVAKVHVVETRDGLVENAEIPSGIDTHPLATALRAKITSRFVENLADPRNPLNLPNCGNTFVWKGRLCWSGAFHTADGEIEVAYEYHRAYSADFHHSLYFADNTQAEMADGNMQFFWVDHDGIVQTEWRKDLASPAILRRIAEQITPLPR